MKKRLAIIPAREGSKRIVHKNIRDFCGEPMISYILNTAKASNLFDVIHVSTESSKIKDVVKSFGFDVPFMRSPELADDHTPILPVLKDVVQKFKFQNQIFDQVWLLMACSPLVEENDLREAAQFFEQSRPTKTVIAVSEYQVPIEWAFERSEEGVLSPLNPGMFSIRSQDIKKKYHDAGVFAIFDSNQILGSEGAGSDLDFKGYVLPKYKAIDIDNEEDWLFAEKIFKSNTSVIK